MLLEVELSEEVELVELLDAGGSEVSPMSEVDSTGSGLVLELMGVLCGVEKI